MFNITLHHYLAVSIILASIGIAGVMVRRSLLIIITSIQLTLMAASLAFVAFARAKGLPEGYTIALIIVVIAAAEAVVGLAVIIAAFRTRPRTAVDDFSLMKG